MKEIKDKLDEMERRIRYDYISGEAEEEECI